MDDESEIYSKLGQFLANNPKIQEASPSERYSWLRLAGLEVYINAADLAADDSALAFISKLVSFLSKHRPHLAAFLHYLATSVLIGREADTAREFVNSLSQPPSQVPISLSQPPPQVSIGVIASLHDFLLQHNLDVGEDDLFAVKAENQVPQLLQSVFVSDIRIGSEHGQTVFRFHDLLTPRSLCLFALPGYGKTSLCMELARRVRDERQPPVLVCHIDNEALAASGKTGGSCRDLVVRTVLSELRERLTKPRSLWHLLKTDEMRRKFLALERAFYGTELPIELSRPPVDDIAAQAQYYQQQRDLKMGFTYWVNQVWSLVWAAGFGNIYLLIDQVDDYLEPDYDPQEAMDMLQHLLVPSLLALPGNRVAWKFFLNTQLHDYVRERVGPNAAFYHLGPWNERDLLRLFNFRLTYFARRGNLRDEKQFIDFCEPDVTRELLHALAARAHGSPRTFIDLVKEIFTTHCQSRPPLEALIARSTIEEIIRRHQGAPPVTFQGSIARVKQRSQEHVNVSALRQILTTHFNESELRDLCFDLNIDYERLPGQGTGDKARELVAYVGRYGRTAELVEVCRRLRPNADWHNVDQTPPT